MEQRSIMITATNMAATGEQVREPKRELTEDELAHVSGGVVKDSHDRYANP
jgi:bacteriocin-like protein